MTGKGVSLNYLTETIALKRYEKDNSGENGFALAQFNLGMMYGRGQAFLKVMLSFKWFQKAAEQGHAGAQNNLGMMYENGKGVEQSDAEEAVENGT